MKFVQTEIFFFEKYRRFEGIDGMRGYERLLSPALMNEGNADKNFSTQV